MATDEQRARNREAVRRYREANPDKVRERNARNAEKRLAAQRADQAANPDKYLGYHLRRQYGLTVAEYDAMLDRAAHKCEICGCAVVRAKWKRATGSIACVDHCHETGRVRGILCRPCNSWLGRVSDQPERAVRYLARAD